VNAHAMWYLTRGTGLVALILVTASVLIGIAASMRAGGTRMPRFVVSGLHRNVSLLTVAFIVVHVVTTIADAYAPITFVDAVVPFISAYRPIWLGLGALAFDIILALVITSLVRVRIGLKTWRGIHWFAYACFPITVVHALGTGSDASQHWLLAVVIGCVGLVGIAILARLWGLLPDRRPAAPPVRRMPSPTGRYLTRAVATVAVLALPVLGAMWAIAGPLAPKWAQRAGTPASSKATPNPLADLAARQARLDRLRVAQIHATSQEVAHQLAQVRATLAQVRAASQPVRAASSGYASSSGSSSSGGGSYSAGSSASGSSGGGGGGSAAVSAPAPVAAVPAAPAAPVAATGGS